MYKYEPHRGRVNTKEPGGGILLDERWPAAKVEARKTKDLVPYARNSRVHTPAQVDQIAASIREFGWTAAVLVDEDETIIAGHGRIMAAQKLGIEEVPVMVARGWTEAQKKAYRITDNRLTELSTWDQDLLRIELDEISLAGLDISLTGFGDLDFSVMGEDDLARAEEAPEPPVEPVTVPGDVWLLGNHRLVCGDSTSADDVAKALNGATPHLMVTDPPYGVEYDANWRNEAARHSDGMGNRCLGAGAVGKVLNDDKADWREAWALFPGDVVYVWHAGLHAATVADSLTECGFQLRSQIIWAKGHFAIGRGDYHWHHEPCWYAVRKGKAGHYCGDRKQTTLWQIDKPQKSETGHSTQKPIECMKKPIENNSALGDAIYEPFSGSGTTIIAAEMTGRKCHAIELSPAYVDVAIRRWQDFTGKQAIHADTGEVFNDLAVARLKKGEVHGSRGNAAPARDKKRAGKNAR